VITVNGKAVNPGDGDSDGGGVQEVLRAARLELRLCRALVALRPPRDVSLLVHARAAELLRVRGCCASMTPPTRTPPPPPTWAIVS
jgi:hypothetical protein